MTARAGAGAWRKDVGGFRDRLEAEIFENGQSAAERDGLALMVEARVEFVRAVARHLDEFDADLIAASAHRSPRCP